MSESLLPTPNVSGNTNGYPDRREKNQQMELADVVASLISASSPGSEDSTSPSRQLSDPDASDRLSGTNRAEQSSLDIGPTSLGGETSPTSALLSTPSASDATSGGAVTRSASIKADIRRLLPTPTSQNIAEGMTTERWDEWTQEMKARHANGNGHGRNLSIEVRKALTSSAEVSLVSPSLTLASARAARTAAGSGPSSPVLWASLNPDGLWSRTYLGCFQPMLDGRLEESSETWPRSGSMHGGSVSAHPTSELPTDGSGSSSSLNVPTPTSSDAIWSERDHSRRGIVRNHNLGLVDWARMLPSPTASEGMRGGNQHPVKRQAGGHQPNLGDVIEHGLGGLTEPPSDGGKP